MRRRRKVRPMPAQWESVLRTRVEEDVRAMLAAGWSESDVVVLIIDLLKERLIDEVTSGLIDGGIRRPRCLS